jgi:glycosyltransferase involved in cell wall biosynthesis
MASSEEADFMNAPRRVYWLTEAFYPPIVGGQELFAARVVRALADRGLQMTVITRQSEPPAPPFEMIGPVRVRRIAPAGILKGKGWRAIVPLLGFLLRLLLILLRDARNFDVIVVSGVKIIPLVAVPVCLLTGRTCILRAESFFELHEAVSAESLQTMRGAGRGIGVLADRIRRFVIRRADYVIAISAEIRAQLASRGVPTERIREIPNAVDTEKFHPVSASEKRRLRIQHGLPADRTLLVFSGRLSRAKGLPMLVEAWPELVARHPEVFLVIVGSGKLSFDDCEAEIREFVSARDLGGSIAFAGESERVYEYLQAADVFIFPTEYEGFSLALVEALACAMPVVVTAVGAAPDLIRHGENGFLFPPKDPPALLAVLDEALDQRSRWPQIGDAARLSVTPYDLRVVADRYRELCSGPSA